MEKKDLYKSCKDLVAFLNEGNRGFFTKWELDEQERDEYYNITTGNIEEIVGTLQNELDNGSTKSADFLRVIKNY